jgi:hypothetical protein
MPPSAPPFVEAGSGISRYGYAQRFNEAVPTKKVLATPFLFVLGLSKRTVSDLFSFPTGLP